MVWFYGTSSILGYLMLNPPHAYLLNMYVNILLKTFLNELKLILFHTVTGFQVLLCITNNSFKNQSFVYTQLNDQAVLFQTIQFSLSHLFALSLIEKQFYKVLLLPGRVDLGVMATKRYFAFFKAPASLEPHHQVG